MRRYAIQSTIAAKLTTLLVALVVASTAHAQPPTKPQAQKTSRAVKLPDQTYMPVVVDAATDAAKKTVEAAKDLAKKAGDKAENAAKSMRE